MKPSIDASPARTHEALRDLRAIIEEILALEAPSPRALERVQRRHPKPGHGFYSKREILAAFRELAPRAGWSLPDEAFAERLRTCPTRSLSGVLAVTVLTKPFPCPGRCVFCPSDVRMPKSYLAAEPGCQRAEANRFDPYLQTWNRLLAYRRMGHPTDKIELIVLGGTWSSYPAGYRRWFLTRCFEALCDFGAGDDGRDAVARFTARFPASEAPASDRGRYNERIRLRLRAHHGGALAADWEEASLDRLLAAQRANEASAVRCVGLAVETRPDAIDGREIEFLRLLGVTKLQIGVQSLSDPVLECNRRGHDVAATRRALRALRGAGFKLHVHWMANLLGSSPAADVEDFARLFDDPAIRPDELKLYPCSLLESAELVDHYRAGRWRPYTEEELEQTLMHCLAAVPRTCRTTRVIRDIPSPEILVGNRRTNLRERVEARAAREGLRLRDIRSREIRGEPVATEALALRETRYRAGGGEERFLEFVTPEDRIAGFLRLHLPQEPGPLPEIEGAALIREVHVYGRVAGLGRGGNGRAQHSGLGSRLVARSCELAAEAGFERLAVISAVGTRPYYRRLGFRDGALYQHRRTG